MEIFAGSVAQSDQVFSVCDFKVAKLFSINSNS